MTEKENTSAPAENTKKSFWKSTAFRASAGTLAGLVALSGAFVAGSATATVSDRAGFYAMAGESRGGEIRTIAQNGPRNHSDADLEQGARTGKINKSKSHAGGSGHGGKAPMSIIGLDEDQRLDALNEFLDSKGLETVSALPEKLTGDTEELTERAQLEHLNRMLEQLGLDAVTELPDDFPEGKS